MPALLLYLLKANGALLLFAGLYYVGLRRLTFFGLNRAYLLFALLFSALYPALDLTAVFAPQTPLSAALLTTLPAWSGTLAAPTAPALGWIGALAALYWTGVAAMSLRLAGRLISLYRLHRVSAPGEVEGVAVRCLAEAGSPFSFGPFVYLNPDQYSAAELPAILHHELVHVRQWHTLDVLLAQVAQVLCWFNPVAWWLGRAVQQNLEFLTDAAVLRAGLVSPKAYQYSLLRLSGLATGAELANHFSLPTLKTRIMMMNKPASARASLTQYALVLPLVTMLLLAFAPSRAEKPTADLPGNTRYYLNGEPVGEAVVNELNTRPNDIASVQVVKGKAAQTLAGDAAVEGVVVLITKGRENLPAVQALNERIARLLPATPAPTKTIEEKTVAISNLHPAALAYITQHFPNHRLIEVREVKGNETSEPRYKAVIATGRRPTYVLFDPQGKALGSFDAAGKLLE